MIPHFWRLTGVYVFAFVAVALLLIGILWAIERFLGTEISSGSGVVTTIVAAMTSGQAFYKWEKRIHTGREAWGFSAWATLLNVVICAPILVYLWSVGFFSDLDLGLDVFAGIIGVVTLLHFLATRFFFGFGIKQMAKVDARG